MAAERIDLAGKRFAVLGIQGSGKSVLVKNLLATNDGSFVYDVLREHYGYNRYLVAHRQVMRHRDDDPAIAELNGVVNRVVLKSGQVRMFVLEEANRYCPPKPAPLPASILDLNDFNRHYNIAFGAVARRPSQLNSDLINLAHYIFIFRLVGGKDRAALDEEISGLGDVVKSLPDYHFVVVKPDRTYYVSKPVTFSKSEAISNSTVQNSADVLP